MAEATGLVILTERGEVNYLLINRLAAEFPIAAVAFETDHQGKRQAMLRHRRKKLGHAKVLGQLAYLAAERLLRPTSAKAAALLAQQDVSPPDGRFVVVEAPRVNDEAVKDLLRQAQPPVVVVSGTGIIRQPVLDLAPVFLNIHCGITPRYRGVHGGYWAVWEGRPEDAGVTIHAIDTGVDTGDIAYQGRIQVEPDDDARSLVVKQYQVGAELMATAVADALAGRLRLRPGEGESKQWYHPTLADDRRFRRNLRALAPRRALPGRDDRGR